VYLENGKTTTKNDTSALDQRINGIDAVALNEENGDHLVIAGDSNGMVHIFVVSAQASESSRSATEARIFLSEWPIICVKVVVVLNRVLVMFGTTKGSVFIVDVPRSSSEIRNAIHNQNEIWRVVGVFEGHGMGTNCIDTHVLCEDECQGVAKLCVATGGDDHSLSFAHLTLRKYGVETPLTLAQEPRIQSLPGASYSAMKSVFFLFYQGRPHLLSVGYSQTLCLWKISDEGQDYPAVAISNVPVDLGDVNGMSICVASSNDLEVWIAVCGMGVEMFKLCLMRID
jgi:WD40 repeat protein